ncbi:hypothetical protein MTR67_021691 [Solanum verrucosum]|uniref:Origin of replication complex subunit 4 n=1 Tax=Solanum verrucosum TaxID=315347 RepID=A0AAF0QRY6_SOLVR|nr:hypothetical protein MTR67_021691 [Solanum verrucosum]
MGVENPAEQGQILLRTRLCNPNFIYTIFSDSPDSNYSKLKYIMSSSVTEACNNSALLLGPRGCGKVAILEMVIKDLLHEYPDTICVIKLNGLLHSEDNCALKEIARQLCIENQLVFSKMASFDDNSQFVIAMLRECGLAHKTIIFVLDEFDLFTQGKQRLLYSLLDAMQSVTSQAVVVGVSCRLDADQLLEKRVRSRFSHRKLLFLPPSREDLQKILQHALLLPTESSLPPQYVAAYNKKLLNTLSDDKFKDIIDSLCNFDATFNHLLRFLFASVCHMDTKSGFLSLDNFKTALSSIQRQPKLEALQVVLDIVTTVVKGALKACLSPEMRRKTYCSILELYILVCLRRLEGKEQETTNFNSVMKEYKDVHNSFQTTDYYARNVCLRAFEHLLQRQLISLVDNRGHSQSVEFRPVRLLISSHELHQGLKAYRSCPAILHKLLDLAV